MNNLIKLSKYISEHIKTYKKVKVKKTDLYDGLLFNLLYTEKHVTKDALTAKYNNLTKKNISRQAYTNRANQIDINYYEKLFIDIRNYINKNIYNNHTTKIYAVDGCKVTCNVGISKDGYQLNKNKNSATILTLGIYNVIDGNIANLKSYKDTNERNAFCDLNKHISNEHTNIFLFDRGFFGCELIDMLNNQNKFYIIRLKENLNIIQKNNIDDDYITKHKNIDTRLIRYKINKIFMHLYYFIIFI